MNIEEWIGSWIIPCTHYCTVLWLYDNQYINDKRRDPKTFKTINDYMDLYEITDKRELFRHWDCIEKGINCGR